MNINLLKSYAEFATQGDDIFSMLKVAKRSYFNLFFRDS